MMFAHFRIEKIGDVDGFPATLRLDMETALAGQLAEDLKCWLSRGDGGDRGDGSLIAFYLAGRFVRGGKDFDVAEVVTVLAARPAGAPLTAAQAANKLAKHERRIGSRRHEKLRRIARNARFFADALEREAAVLEDESAEIDWTASGRRLDMFASGEMRRRK